MRWIGTIIPGAALGAGCSRNTGAGQAIQGDARGTPNTAPPPVTPRDNRAGQFKLAGRRTKWGR